MLTLDIPLPRMTEIYGTKYSEIDHKNFMKADFHKFYLVRYWIPFPHITEGVTTCLKIISWSTFKRLKGTSYLCGLKPARYYQQNATEAYFKIYFVDFGGFFGSKNLFSVKKQSFIFKCQQVIADWEKSLMKYIQKHRVRQQLWRY